MIDPFNHVQTHTMLEKTLLYAAAIISTIVGALAAIGRALVARLIGEMDRRLDGIEDKFSDIDRLDDEIAKLRAELPLHYNQREDAVREYSVVLARIDAVGRGIEQAVRRDDYIRDVSVLHAKMDALVLRIDRVMETKS